MAKLIPPKIRLAGPGTAVSEVFNFYQVFTLLSSLYLKASDREDEREYKKIWTAVNDDLLMQIGDVHSLWSAAQKGATAGIPIPEDINLIARTARLAMRMLAVESAISVWTPISKWARILCLLEKKLQRLAGQIADHNPFIAKELQKFKEESQKRFIEIRKIEESAMASEASIRADFAIPIDL